MKTKRFILSLLLLFAIGTVGAYAQDIEKTRSYYCQQTAGPDTRYGPNVQVPLKDATYVEWYSDNTIKMMDGTIWQYQG